jgi:hypothetical protein
MTAGCLNKQIVSDYESRKPISFAASSSRPSNGQLFTTDRLHGQVGSESACLAYSCRYLNARNTFAELLAYGAIPVVNENDTVAVQELRFGDNDTLSAQVVTNASVLLAGCRGLFQPGHVVGCATLRGCSSHGTRYHIHWLLYVSENKHKPTNG